MWGLALTKGLRVGVGVGDAYHATSFSPDIRYEKPNLLPDFHSLSTEASSEVCQAWIDTIVFKVAAL